MFNYAANKITTRIFDLFSGLWSLTYHLIHSNVDEEMKTDVET